MTIIDTHLHLIYRDVLRYPWIDDAPALQQDFTLQRYQTEARRCGIGDALHMEVDVDAADIETETQHVKRLAAEPGALLRGAISACRPESPDFPAFLERQLADPFVKGFRRVLHVMPDDLSDTAHLLERLRGGDRQALTDLFQRQRDRLRRMVELRMDARLQGLVDASDVPEDAFLDAANHPG